MDRQTDTKSITAPPKRKIWNAWHPQECEFYPRKSEGTKWHEWKKIRKYKTAKYPIFYTDGFNDEVIETKKKLAGRQAAGAQRDRRRQINKATEKEMKAY